MKGAYMLNIQTEKQYNKIVENYSDMIFRIAYQYLYNKYDAEEYCAGSFRETIKQKSYF